ncbi:hypothetical protein [Paraburkholderia ferrariae]|uniref:hypothetical protein n=1 Tax=Paraburkholderia ferrariae TaxID=386056 RepID=UPI000A5EFCE1|nr:hypothetical protein [Paraburkholderia ferrariae]
MATSLSNASIVDFVSVTVALAWSGWLVRRDRFSGFFALIATYYTFLILVFHLGGTFMHQEGFTGKIYQIDETTFLHVSLYAATFNLIFFTMLSIGSTPFELRRQDIGMDAGLIRNLYFGVFVLGAVVYFFESGSIDYAGYVSYRGVAYGWVLMIVGTSTLVMAYLMRSYAFMAVVMLIYTYFCLKTGVRSFLLMPMMPLVLLLLANSDRNLGKKLAIYGSAMLAVALALLLLRPASETALPEMFLTHGLHVVFYKYTGASDLSTATPIAGFLTGAFNYFLKIDPDSFDPAIQFAQDFYGFITPDGFYHMPFTWYADSFAAHGYAGVIYGAIWALLIRALKWLTSRDPLTLAAFLPQACWIAFFVIRGAAANATNSVTTPMWLSVALFVFLRLASLAPVRGSIR